MPSSSCVSIVVAFPPSTVTGDDAVIESSDATTASSSSAPPRGRASPPPSGIASWSIVPPSWSDSCPSSHKGAIVATIDSSPLVDVVILSIASSIAVVAAANEDIGVPSVGGVVAG